MTEFNTINPATEAVIATYQWMDMQTIDGKLKQAQQAQKTWSAQSVSQRVDLLNQLKTQLLARQAFGALEISNEMGKPISQSNAEIEKCAKLCDYYLLNGESFCRSESIQTEYQLSQRTFEPIGLVLAIMPWNFPFWQVFRFAIPNLILGNGAILKHAPNVTGCGLFLERLFKEAGFPEGLFTTLIVDVPLVEQVIAHPAIQGVTLTGSCRSGQAVAAAAGRSLKKVVLELGGNDPYLILKDADLDHAAQSCVNSRLNNAGQVCIAAKRILVHHSVKQAFTEKVLKLVADYVVGDPLDPNTKMGPIARQDLRQALINQIHRIREEGNVCLLGGAAPTTSGYYYPATVFDEVSPSSIAFQEELFGPVILMTSFADEQEAIRLANQTEFGLSGAIFTENIERGQYLARQLQVGVCAINTLVVSDPRLPFGGIKQSGFGRELSMEGTREFANIKTVIVK